MISDDPEEAYARRQAYLARIRPLVAQLRQAEVELRQAGPAIVAADWQTATTAVQSAARTIAAVEQELEHVRPVDSIADLHDALLQAAASSLDAALLYGDRCDRRVSELTPDLLNAAGAAVAQIEAVESAVGPAPNA